MLLLVANSVFLLLLKQSGSSGSDTTCTLHSTTPWSWWVRDQMAGKWRELKNKGWSLVDVPSQVTFNISNHCCCASAPVHTPRLARAPSISLERPWPQGANNTGCSHSQNGVWLTVSCGFPQEGPTRAWNLISVLPVGGEPALCICSCWGGKADVSSSASANCALRGHKTTPFA